MGDASQAVEPDGTTANNDSLSRDVITWRSDLLRIGAALAVMLFAASAVPQDGSAASSESQSEGAVHMTLVHPKLETDVLVPLEYLGPRLLQLSEKNRLGGEQSRFLVEFYYPSLQPNTPGNAHLGDTELLTYVSIANTLPGAARRGGEAKTGTDNSWFEATGEEVCGLREFRSVVEHYEKSLYWYKDASRVGDSRLDTTEDNVFSADVYMLCDASGTSLDHVNRCRWRFDTKRNLGLIVNAIPQSMLCDWPELTTKLRILADGFVVNED